MDSMNEENDEYGDTVSSAPKRMRCRTSSVWSDFEILPKGSDGKERAKCKKCQNTFVAGSSGTTSLLRHRAKCHEIDNQIVSRQPLDQAMYREMVALAIIRHNYPFTFVEHENNSVKYVRGSDHRKLRFAQCLSELPFLTSKKVRQDVPTRWNSTYLMIETCLKYRDAFSHLSRIDKYFLNCPSEEEWERVEKIARVLEPFYDITKLFSGTNYPTANLYFHCVWKIQLRIMEQLEDDDMIIRAMAKEMKEKFDKYWEYYSPVLSFAVILDPRYKLQCVEFCYSKLYKQEAISMAANLRDTLYGIFEEYKNSTSDICNVVEVASSSGGVRGNYVRHDDFSGFETYKSQLIGSDSSKSQLDLYLEETRLDYRLHEDLNVMGYWKSHTVHDFEEESLVEDFGNLCLSQSSSFVDED
ncbi:hypothetical protein SO802_028271 [Lithocarpus litseifolius]|uniref:BED-type domain-containing protein n=1 Tax=Lithocarpus litseifolius TaxID=425828 RepID=A0AAW2BQE9_9ROSI